MQQENEWADIILLDNQQQICDCSRKPQQQTAIERMQKILNGSRQFFFQKRILLCSDGQNCLQIWVKLTE